MQVIMEMNGNRRKSNGNRRKFFAEIDGNRRKSPFVPRSSKIPLGIGEFTVVFFDSPIKGSCVDRFYLQIA